MKKLHYLFVLVLLILLAFSCVKEDYYTYSNRAEILRLELSNQSGNTTIFSDNDSIYIEVANGVDLTQLNITHLSMSSFAQCNYAENDVIDCSSGEVNFTVTAEDGTEKIWKVAVFEVGSQPQISNSDFEIWHQESSYLDIGADDASSAWGTSNPGAVFGGIDPNVLQVENGADGYAAKLITRFTYLGAVVNKPIAAGSLFTGDFDQDNISLTNPIASVKFGIPFTAHPLSFSVDYQYTPGPNNIDAHQNTLPYSDKADLYVLLERREGELVKRVATAWYREEMATGTMQTLSVDFMYGELPTGTPDYMLPSADESYALPEETATHITVVFSSSANGNLFEGAKDSELIVDNFKLIY